MSDERVSAWDGDDFGALLALDQLGPNRLRSRSGEANDHDRVYGGQLLAQTVMAAARTVAPDRPPTALQFLFLQGARPERPIDYEVTTLQEGKRFSARHVRGAQAGGRLVCDAQLSFGMALDGPAHMAAPDVAAFADEDPETLPRLTDLPPALGAEIHRVMSYAFAESRAVDLRAPDGAAGHAPADARTAPALLDQNPPRLARRSPAPRGGLRLSLGLVAELSRRRRPCPRDRRGGPSALRRQPQSRDLVAPPFARRRMAPFRQCQPERGGRARPDDRTDP